MAGVNKVIIVGNLGRDPELRYTQGGTPVAQLSLATTRTYTNRNNERVDDTEWHRVVVWGKQAESCNQYLEKGRQVYVEGRLQTRSWDDNDGNKRYTTEIVAESVQFLGGGANRRDRNDDRDQGNQRSNYNDGDRGGNRSEYNDGDRGRGGEWNDNYIPSDPGDDDIPF